ncbi:glycosyltransferase [Isoptericola jiangsuensis]|uniref:glycosyltransferase n=1 Tax=Isoptericola jiangsuensis TaxID=548579 RepID=UPI003AAB45D0
MHPSDPPAPAPEPGRSTGTVVKMVVVSILLALAVSPTVILLALLAGSGGAAPVALAVLSTVFVGPALSAALYALGDSARDDGLGPAAAFVKGYRLNVVDVLKLWVPALGLIAVLLFAVAEATEAPPWAIGVGIGAVVMILLSLLQSTVIASFFAFRARDVAKLGMYFLARLPRVTLVVVVLITAAGAVAFLTAPAVLALLGGLWTALLLKVEKPLLAEVRLRFVTG